MRRIITVLAAMVLITATAYGQSFETQPRTFKKNSTGAGLGIPYGVLGTNTDINVAPNLNISAGIGTTVFAGLGYSFGLKYFLTSVEHTFRPRISGYYGINSMIVVEDQFGIGDNGTSYAGFSFGLGAQWMWGRSKSNGLDLDLIYIASRGDFDSDREQMAMDGYEVSDPGRIKISIGYRHAL